MAYSEAQKKYVNSPKGRAVHARWCDTNIERHRANERNRRVKRIALIRTAKSKPCMDCGNSYPYYAMDFDHRNPEEKSLVFAKPNVEIVRSRLCKKR